MNFTERILIMGIVNRTPDSFYDGGQYFDEEGCLAHVARLIEEGADIIDIGGESSRPGSEPVSIEEELRRTVPIIEKVSAEFDITISIDTYKAEVARRALEAGAGFINDISAFRADSEMAKLAAQFDCPVCLMHMQGEPGTMQDNPYYEDLVGEIMEYLSQSIKIARDAGVRKENIVIDPGIGFGKTAEHNLTILKNLPRFKELGYPVLIGASRKSFIGKVLEKGPEGRLAGSLAVATLAALRGANIIRTHDVSQTADCLRMIEVIEREGIRTR